MEFRADKHVSNYPKFEINFLWKRTFFFFRIYDFSPSEENVWKGNER
jgi:hypothetical protein